MMTYDFDIYTTDVWEADGSRIGWCNAYIFAGDYSSWNSMDDVNIKNFLKETNQGPFLIPVFNPDGTV